MNKNVLANIAGMISSSSSSVYWLILLDFVMKDVKVKQFMLTVTGMDKISSHAVYTK